MKKLIVLFCFLSAFAYGQTPQPNSIFPNGLQSVQTPLTSFAVLRYADTSFLSTKANSVTLAQLQTRLNLYVPKSLTITINGVTQDLSTNRVFTIAMNTYTAGNGLTLTGSQFLVDPTITAVLNVAQTYSAIPTFGNGSIHRILSVNGATGNTRDLNFQTSGVNRAILRLLGDESAIQFRARNTDGSDNGVLWDGNLSTRLLTIGNLSATGTLAGNATTATTLQNTRTINGVSFNGSTNITVADATKEPIISGTGLVRKSGTTTTFDNTAYGTGSVTNVSATNSTGVTFSISNPTNTPNISLALTSSAVGLGNAENKSSATIRGELTGSNVTSALGYTPVAASSVLLLDASYQAVSGLKLLQGGISIDNNIYFNGTASDSEGTALGFQWNNRPTGTNPDAGWRMILGVGNSILWKYYTGFSPSTYSSKFRFNPSGVINYMSDITGNSDFTSNPDALAPKRYVDSKLQLSGETRYDIDWFLNSSTTLGTSMFGNYSTLVVAVDCANGNKSVILPAVSAMSGKKIIIIKIDASANTVSIIRDGESVLINGAYTYTLTTRYQSVELRTGGNVYSSVGADQYYAR